MIFKIGFLAKVSEKDAYLDAVKNFIQKEFKYQLSFKSAISDEDNNEIIADGDFQHIQPIGFELSKKYDNISMVLPGLSDFSTPRYMVLRVIPQAEEDEGNGNKE